MKKMLKVAGFFMAVLVANEATRTAMLVGASAPTVMHLTDGTFGLVGDIADILDLSEVKDVLRTIRPEYEKIVKEVARKGYFRTAFSSARKAYLLA